MVVDINLGKQYIDLWLGHGEPVPDLEACQQKYPGYDIAVFRSGEDSLAFLTAELLKSNL